MPPDEEDRPGDQETTGATVYQHHDKQATTPADAVRDSTAGADNRAGAKIADGPNSDQKHGSCGGYTTWAPSCGRAGRGSTVSAPARWAGRS